MKLLFLIVGFGLGLMWGWIAAHQAVADECGRLGGFLVGEKTYKCRLIESREGEP